MISSPPIRTDERKRELLYSDTEQFPYVCFYRELDDSADRTVSWHWHPELEVDYVLEGEIEYQTMEKIVTVKAGELVFLNSNILHTVYAKNKQPGCKMYAHLFDISLLSGSYNSVFHQKYVLPVVRNTGLSVAGIFTGDERREAMKADFLEAVRINEEKAFGYEFELRSRLSHLWILLLQRIQKLQIEAVRTNTMDVERIKEMLEYIHYHYHERLTLERIAESASISPRECARCFRRCIRTSPVNYLNRYRIQQAAQMLLDTPDSITTISENCGFSTGSYFGKAFHEIMGCTPSQYRKGRS